MSGNKFGKEQEVFSSIVSRYYGDPDFKARMDADPAGVLREAGIDIPKDVDVKLLFNTDDTLHIVLPFTDES